LLSPVAPATVITGLVDLHHAAFSHIDVSNALLISGMFMPKLALAALFAAGLAGFSQGLVVSVARSQEPSSWERATEKNRST
jgi:hypothetical protein